ncbi:MULTISPECIES: YtcA family lipoprotein [unclassified Serratia (in: enterobacteria)]|uniref:YtcA family lipoprotein n=1 Tax=unclassified Serratia (in: enterobacteria) TaxID=2647522 RepID=UPI00068F9F6D|nr:MULTISPECIES: YtcA family lipoprotein [unclassified Serratia (in: enterobacteria)]
MNNMTSFRKLRVFSFTFFSTAQRHQWGRLWALLLVSVLSGCTVGEAPSFSLIGSYFPAWMACAFIGIIAAIMARVLFIRVGIDEALPWRLFVYVCLALAVAFLCSLLLFTR